MAKFVTKQIDVEAEQWTPGKEISGVVEETKLAKGGEPEVTHGLLLIPGLAPIQYKDKDGNAAKAKVGDTLSAGRGHIELPSGSTVFVIPGEWVVKDATGILVLSDAEFKSLYEEVK